MLSTIKIQQKNSSVPLSKLAQIVLKNPQTFFITPFDQSVFLFLYLLFYYKQTIKDIQNSLTKSGHGFNPIEEKGGLLIPVPRISKEVRDEKIKLVHQYSEDCKQRIRRVRTKGLNEIKSNEKLEGISEDMIKKQKKEFQNLIDKFVKEVENFTKIKTDDLNK